MQETKENNLLKSILKSKWYPGILQVPVVIVFAFIMYELFFGPVEAHENFGTALTWVLWWPLIPLIFLLFGRFWCGICPFGTVSDYVQKIVGNNRPVPKFLKKYGVWIIDIFFILITWGDHVYGIVESPRGSGVVMLILAAGAITAGAFFERRTWCRHICFLGGVAGNYSRTGTLELRGTPDKCNKCTVAACYKGGKNAPGCPMFEFPRTMDNSARCNLCGHCVKNCPNDSITVSVRPPSKELWFIRKPKFEESFLAIVIMGIVFVQNITMLEIWDQAQSWLENALGTHEYAITFTVTFLIAMAIPVGLLYISSWIAGKNNGESTHMNFARFGYALIPLDLSAHMAHNLFHLLAEGKSILFTGMAVLGMNVPEQSTAFFSVDTIQVLQYILLVVGTLGSIYTAYRIAKSQYSVEKIKGSALPFICLIIILLLANIYFFMLPMMHRM